MTMDKEKLLAWIEMRINDHKQRVKEIYERNDDDKPKYFVGNDRKEYDYHTGATAELVFLRKCVFELKAFDIESTESAKQSEAEGSLEEDLTKMLDLDGAINEYFKKKE